MIRTFVLVIVVSLVSAASVQAQGTFPGMGSPLDREVAGVPYMRYAKPGETTVQVMVVGAVGAPGIYVIGESTRLDELLALSRGLGTGMTPANTTQKSTVQLYRRQGGERVLIYEASVEDMLREPDTYPELQDDDIFRVDTVVRQRWTWREGLQVVSSAASLIFVAVRLVELAR